MKKKHVDLVWESLENFDRANISFGQFLEQLGQALESANTAEAKVLGEAARNLEFALVSGSNLEIRKILNGLRHKVFSRLQPND